MRTWASALLLGAALVSGACTLSASPPQFGEERAGAAQPSRDIVRDKNFPFLAMLQADPSARAAIARDPLLAALGERSRRALATAFPECRSSTRCLIEAMLLPDADIVAVGKRLAQLAESGPVKDLIRLRMRPSGKFRRYEAQDDDAFIAAAWNATAAGVNRLYRVYGLGEAPRYPAIDSISYEPESNAYRNLVRAVFETQIDGARPGDLFFADWLQVGLDLLVINQRDEAARYEPMENGVNAAAFQRVRSINWANWQNAAIMVPGAGTNEGERGLSAAGALRARLAARRYADGLAPFLVVSGGHVHPNKTLYAEAMEMKKELMARYGVPEDAIVVDPHARHTTTNLRNGVRLIHALGAPEDKPVLVTTSRDQSAYIESPAFVSRNETELGYQPMTFLRRLSPSDITMSQNLLSLHADPNDPLDP